MSKTTCGVDMHDDDCLCDVIIKEPVAITIPDGVDGMWMGSQVCEIRGYGLPWTKENMVEYFSDLCLFYDRWSELQEQKFAHKNPAHERMVQLLRQGVKNSEIRRVVMEEYGVEYSRSAVSHTKRRIGLSTSSVD